MGFSRTPQAGGKGVTGFWGTKTAPDGIFRASDSEGAERPRRSRGWSDSGTRRSAVFLRSKKMRPNFSRGKE
jgi:hypothetical protein